MNYKIFTLLLVLFLSGCDTIEKNPNKKESLSKIKKDLKKQWPNNKTINLVFHGHSVPAGYFETPEVRTFDSYPLLVLKHLKENYPFAVINIINTSKGGETSINGAQRFENDVLIHNPDIIFIDYGLNEQNLPINKIHSAILKMVKAAIRDGSEVFLLTPSPDLRIDILNPKTQLSQIAETVRTIADDQDVHLIDSYKNFQKLVQSGENLDCYMSHFVHPNKKGHELIANEIVRQLK